MILFYHLFLDTCKLKLISSIGLTSLLSLKHSFPSTLIFFYLLQVYIRLPEIFAFISLQIDSKICVSLLISDFIVRRYCMSIQ